ncbi:class I SAM-dependent methyltransferase [Paenibacillus tarimensis]
MSLPRGNESIVRKEFKKQAKGFSNPKLTINSEELLHWVRSSLNLNAGMTVLDVAAGTGILSRSIAPFVQHVTSIDLSQNMINEGKILNTRLNIANIDFMLGHAEEIPCANGSFDLAVSRLAFHHFTNPMKVLHEMCRVSKLSGSVCVVDMISPENDGLCKLYNHYERLRDPSHTTALKKSEFEHLFNQLDLEIQVIETLDVPVHVSRWLELTDTDAETTGDIIRDIELELETGNVVTGLFPYVENEEMMFRQKWIKIIGKRIHSEL